ncbi:MAG: hypothetical protein B7X39_14105 [Lysobacterales bacterium 14-68-21]|jgi:P4 family phage/plasmid primase-like protien|nr:MAG: hypothetical protein B7X45_12995 [Xanthomonadales bacterium 15-68-25]OZB65379.1 MAG: hypothetical protein B7X39_14105 [Xanthomonadales bacterium 14-68-21]
MAFKTKASAPKPKKTEHSVETIFCQAYLKKPDWACEWTDKNSPALMRRWNGQFWEMVTPTELRMEATDWLMKNAPDKHSARRATSCAETLLDHMARNKPLIQPQTKDVVVSTPGGYIHIDPQGVIRVKKPDRSLGVTHGITLSVSTQPGAIHQPKPLDPSSKLGKMLAYAHPDSEVLAFVQEQCGAVLWPGSLSQAAWWFGVPAASKSTLAEMVASVSRQTVRLNLKQLNKDFGLEGLLGANLVLVDEADGGRISDESIFKTLVTGNGASVNRKHEKMVHNYHSQAKWIISCNDAPFIRDKSGAVERRLGIVEWCHAVPESERVTAYHKVLLDEEGEQFLDWLLEGLVRIIKRGGKMMEQSQRPMALRNLGESIRLETDSVMAWTKDVGLVHSPTSKASKNDVYAHYAEWCQDAQREPLDRDVFWRQLKGRRYVEGWNGGDTQQSVNGRRVRMVPFKAKEALVSRKLY